MRLVVDLLGHEVREAALLGGGRIPVDVIGLPHPRGPVKVDDARTLGRDGDNLVLVELKRLTSRTDEGRNVGAKEGLTVADTHDQRAVAAGTHHDPGLVGMHGQQSESTLQLRHDLAHSLGEVTDLVVGTRQQLGDYLGIGLAQEHDAIIDQGGPQSVKVLDDAVVDQRQLTVLATAVGVRILVGRCPMGGPPGVPDRGVRLGQWLQGQGSDEVGQLPCALGGHDVVPSDQGHAGRVVATVLEPGQALHDYLKGPAVDLRSYISHDSTHGLSLTGGARSPGQPRVHR